MKHIYVISKVFPAATLLAACFLVAGCFRDAGENHGPVDTTGTTEVSFSMELPGAHLPQARTRATLEENENEVSEIDLILFDVASGAFVGRYEVPAIDQNGTSVTFKVRLENRSQPTLIVMAANSRGYITRHMLPMDGHTRRSFVGSLLNISDNAAGDTSGSWKWDVTAKPIPMYGEKQVGSIGPAMTLNEEPIALTRMLARIDVGNTPGSGFTLGKIHLVNHYSAGFVAPPWDDITGEIIEPRPNGPYNPGDSYRQTGIGKAIEYDYTPGSDNVMEGQIYTYEAPWAVDGDLGNAVCLILEGTYNGAASFYRVDFTTDDATDPSNIKYVALLRNYKYIVNIQKAVGHGYPTMQAALESYTMPSNLKTKIMWYDEAKLSNIAFNGQYMLGIGAEEIRYEHPREQEIIYVPVYTDAPGGWTASIEEGDWWLKFVEWPEGVQTLSSSVTGNTDDPNSRVGLMVHSTYPNSERWAKINFTANNGRLQVSLVAYQPAFVETSEFYVRLYDADGNELPKNIDGDYTEYVMQFGLGIEQDRVEPQRFYVRTGLSYEFLAFFDPVVWLSKGVIEYASTSTPLLLEGGRSGSYDGTVRYSDDFVAFDLEPTPRQDADINAEYEDHIRFYTFGNNGQTINTVSLRVYQSDWLTVKDIDDGNNERYLLGNVDYKFTINANTPWKIQSISETSLSGQALSAGSLLKAGSGADYLRAGLTGGTAATGINRVETTVKFTTGRWVEDCRGYINVVLRPNNETTSKHDKTIRIEVFEDHLDYTGSSTRTPFFYTFPIHVWPGGGKAVRDDNAASANWTTHRDRCSAIGDGWRLPTHAELAMLMAYNRTVDYEGRDGSKGDFSWLYAKYWSLSTVGSTETGSNASTLFMPSGYGEDQAKTVSLPARCVYTPSKPAAFNGTTPNIPNKPAAGKHYYPYVTANTNGPIIVSRDTDGGVEGVSLGTPAVPDNGLGSDALPNHNRVPSQLQIAPVDISGSPTYKTREQALAACKAHRGGNYADWRLPSMTEMALIWSVGGTAYPQANYTRVNDYILGPKIPGTFTPLSVYANYWTSTVDLTKGNNGAWTFSANRGWGNTVNKDNSGAVDEDGNEVFYGAVRCVRTAVE